MMLYHIQTLNTHPIFILKRVKTVQLVKTGAQRVQSCTYEISNVYVYLIFLHNYKLLPLRVPFYKMANLLNTQINALTLLNECADVIGPLDVAIAEEQGKQKVALTDLGDLMKMRFPFTYTKVSGRTLHNLLVDCGLNITKDSHQQRVVAFTYFKSSLMEIQLQIQENVAAKQCQSILNAKEMCNKFREAAYNNCNRVFNKPYQPIVFQQNQPLHQSEDELLSQVSFNYAPQQANYQQKGNQNVSPIQQIRNTQQQIYERFVNTKLNNGQQEQQEPKKATQASAIEE
ncbi:Hypothetical_protein [Hexamita inflata]|uniref:Hypothetical_protein n=1 Tax=Hexamita inflata TaxID=28002 RepID=A0AA86P4U2_9EUKA|nr:Hypothetical protein HINF_LOCUS19902 [Hexamita inflata]